MIFRIFSWIDSTSHRLYNGHRKEVQTAGVVLSVLALAIICGSQVLKLINKGII